MGIKKKRERRNQHMKADTEVKRIQEKIKYWTKQEEGGLITRYYRDQYGNYTVGYGHNLSAHNEKPRDVTKEEAERIFETDWEEATKTAQKFKGYQKLNQVRKGVITALAYQMGAKIHDFKNFATLVQEEKWTEAALELLKSKWAERDSPNRAWRTAYVFREGREIAVEEVIQMNSVRHGKL